MLTQLSPEHSPQTKQMSEHVLAIDLTINGTRGQPPTSGLIVLVFPLAADDGRVNFYSNGISLMGMLTKFKQAVADIEADLAAGRLADLP